MAKFNVNIVGGPSTGAVVEFEVDDDAETWESPHLGGIGFYQWTKDNPDEVVWIESEDGN